MLACISGVHQLGTSPVVDPATRLLGVNLVDRKDVIVSILWTVATSENLWITCRGVKRTQWYSVLVSERPAPSRTREPPSWARLAKSKWTTKAWGCLE